MSKQPIPPAVSAWAGITSVIRAISLAVVVVALVLGLWAVIRLGQPTPADHFSASGSTWTNW